MTEMQPIIEPVDPDLIQSELTSDKKFMDTNKGGNEIYIVTWHDSPNVLTEIGRLRETAFRDAGGSTGLACDLDDYDKMEKPYHQLIVWDPDARAIIGGYRYLMGSEARLDEQGQPILASSHQFRFSQKFIDDYLPYTVELGRSFVAREYQSSKAGAKAIWAMDNLWDGLASLIFKHRKLMYFFGKVTMYDSFDPVSRDLLLHYMWKHYEDKEELVRPWKMEMPRSDKAMMDLILFKDDPREDFRLLKEAVRRRGYAVPPLFNSYLSTSPTIKMMGTSANELMPGIEDTAILICFNEMYDDKKVRHIDAYLRQRMARIRTRFPLLDPQVEAGMVNKFMSRREKLYAFVKEKVESNKKKVGL